MPKHARENGSTRLKRVRLDMISATQKRLGDEKAKRTEVTGKEGKEGIKELTGIEKERKPEKDTR